VIINIQAQHRIGNSMRPWVPCAHGRPPSVQGPAIRATAEMPWADSHRGAGRFSGGSSAPVITKEERVLEYTLVAVAANPTDRSEVAPRGVTMTALPSCSNL
jgi:hypothetical protein